MSFHQGRVVLFNTLIDGVGDSHSSFDAEIAFAVWAYWEPGEIEWEYMKFGYGGRYDHGGALYALRMGHDYDAVFVMFPHWFPALIFAITPAVWLIKWRKRRKLAMAGNCPACGYDLTGNESGVCPECGEVPATVIHADR